MNDYFDKIGVIFERRMRGRIIIFLFFLFPVIQYFVQFNGPFNEILFYVGIAYLISLFVYTEFNLPRLNKSELLYMEKTASGHSDLNILTKLGGARGCLKLQLSKDVFVISSWFPFSLIAPIFDCVHVIKPSNIVSIKNKNARLSYKYQVQFKMSNSEEILGFTIYPKNNIKFEKVFANYIK